MFCVGFSSIKKKQNFYFFIIFIYNFENEFSAWKRKSLLLLESTKKTKINFKSTQKVKKNNTKKKRNETKRYLFSTSTYNVSNISVLLSLLFKLRIYRILLFCFFNIVDKYTQCTTNKIKNCTKMNKKAKIRYFKKYKFYLWFCILNRKKKSKEIIFWHSRFKLKLKSKICSKINFFILFRNKTNSKMIVFSTR